LKTIILAAAVAALASLAVAAFASAEVARQQVATKLVVSLADAQPGNQHTFTITSACDGTFSGTGKANAIAGGATETIHGTLVGNELSFTAVYDPTSWLPGYTWSYSGPLSYAPLGDATAGLHASAAVTYSTFKNHGDYVSSVGGGDDAAHSCIGMPVQQ
jgi:hypothetical protein